MTSLVDSMTNPPQSIFFNQKIAKFDIIAPISIAIKIVRFAMPKKSEVRFVVFPMINSQARPGSRVLSFQPAVHPSTPDRQMDAS